MGTDEAAHVLDDAEDRDLDLLEHPESAEGHADRDLLGRGDDHGAHERRRLREGDLDVPRAGGEIDDQVIQVAPVHLTEELLDHLRRHGAPPDDGSFAPREESHGDELQARLLRRPDLSPAHLGRRTAAEHGGNRRPVDVGVQEADPGPALGQGQRQVDRHRRLPHAPLPAGHGDGVLHQLHSPFGRRDDGFRDLGGHLDLDPLDPGERLDRP